MTNAVILSTVASIQGMQQCASAAGSRNQDQGKRSNAQTVTLHTKTVLSKPLAVEDPSAGGWAGYSQQQISYAISPSDTSLSWCQSGSMLVMIITCRARQLSIWCGSRHNTGRRL